MRQQHVFDWLSALPAYSNSVERWNKVPAAAFTEHGPGYATRVQPYPFKAESEALYHEYVQRRGSRKEDYHESRLLRRRAARASPHPDEGLSATLACRGIL